MRKRIPFLSTTTAVVVVVALLFCEHQFQQDLAVVHAFSSSSMVLNRLKTQPRYSASSSALSVSFFSSQQTANRAPDVSAKIPAIAPGGQVDDAAPAFLIERISQIPTNERLFHRIADMCIDVFFKELLLDEQRDGEKDDVAGRTRKREKLFPWKDWQIAYLKNLQAADLHRRRRKFGPTNEMFLAYEVVATAPYGARSKPLLLDLESVYNVNTLLKQGRTAGEDEACFVRGRLLGFVEITQRPYGIGTQNEESKEIFMDADGTRRDEDGNELSEFDQRGPLRPVLTNLAVRKDSRKYGIGSKLLDACEQHVQQCWQMNEIILEVEDYNIQALEFYRKRGYDVLFSDPASRRYDVQGLWLRKVRCRRDVMRKVFHGGRMNKVENSAMDLFDRIRQGWR